MMKAYTFGRFHIRPAAEGDRALLETWIAADDDHRGKVKPDFFITPQLGDECMALVDEAGETVVFFKVERVVRLHVQFAPGKSRADKLRTARGMDVGYGWLKEMARNAGIRQILFGSTVAPLIEFCKQRFGFNEAKNDLICPIPGVEKGTQHVRS